MTQRKEVTVKFRHYLCGCLSCPAPWYVVWTVNPYEPFTALVRPLQVSTRGGTAPWASRCRSLSWPWCASSWRTMITRPKMTLWDSSLCPSQAFAQVLTQIQPWCGSSQFPLTVCNLRICFFFPPSCQVIDTFTCWRQMAPVCLQPRSSSTSKWVAEEFQSRVCRSAWPLLKANSETGDKDLMRGFGETKS